MEVKGVVNVECHTLKLDHCVKESDMLQALHEKGMNREKGEMNMIRNNWK